MFVTIKNWFRTFFNVLVWICFIVCIVSGFIIGEKIFGNQIVGGVLGLLVALVINVIFGGFIATIISIDTNLEAIKEKLNGGFPT